MTGNRVRNGSPPAERTAALSVTSDGPGPTSSPAGQVSWSGPSRQEIPLHIELTNLLVQSGDQGGIVSGLLFMTVAGDALNGGGDEGCVSFLHNPLLPDGNRYP